MISRIKNSGLTKFLWGLMGLYMLNISVDTADPNPEYIPENLSINDQESIVEILLEKILGYENAIEETDDNDREDHTSKTNVKVNLIAQNTFNHSLNLFSTTLGQQKFTHVTPYLSTGFHKLDIPPPKI